MKELVVISGKGGTGKTSVAASLAALANGRTVLADCDVDACNLHVLLETEVGEQHDFDGGVVASIRQDSCTNCGLCVEHCRFDAVISTGEFNRPTACRNCTVCVRSCPLRRAAEMQAMAAAVGLSTAGELSVDPLACEGCGVCAQVCPVGAIELTPRAGGQWMVSQTRLGPMVHARLAIGADHSPKLASTVRSEARRLAEREGCDLMIVDGPPGIGGSVIASIIGADLVLIVTEPTLSGLHDLGRVADVARHFGTPALVCVNKWDLNGDMADEIERQAAARDLTVAGRVRYDRAVTEAQVNRKAVVEYQTDGCAEDVRQVWSKITQILDKLEPKASG